MAPCILINLFPTIPVAPTHIDIYGYVMSSIFIQWDLGAGQGRLNVYDWYQGFHLPVNPHYS